MMSTSGRARRLFGRGLVIAVGVFSVAMVTRISTTSLDAEAEEGRKPRVEVTSPSDDEYYPMRAGWTKRLKAHILSNASADVTVVFEVDDAVDAVQFRGSQDAHLDGGRPEDVYVEWTLPKSQPAGRYTLRLAVLGANGGDVLAVNLNAKTFETSSETGATATATATPTATAAPTAVATATAAATATGYPQPGKPCPAWVHDRYTTVGPDGKMYPTWHPPVDAQFGCLFGHEHGADPLISRANSTMPAFGYAASLMNMQEPHEGFKVFVMNAGDVVESNVANKVADQDVRLVFHMGTSGVGRYTQPMHSFQYDLMDHTNGRSAHVIGMADTGSITDAGSTCSSPRKGFKDFSTLGCPDTYEIWNFVRFQIRDPHDPYSDVMSSRFAATPSVAVFDPITTRDPSDNSRLVYTQDVKQNPAYIRGVDPKSPEAFFQGCRREFYAGPAYWNNARGPTVYWTDALGRVSSNNQPDATHPIRQLVSASTGSRPVLYKDRTDYCGNGIHAPN